MNYISIQTSTMLSTEIVKTINLTRDEGRAVLAHGDFMKKIVKVLGERAGNFSSYYTAKNGKKIRCFALEKREATLMVMSESHKVQAAVYDRMEELEHQVTRIPTQGQASVVLSNLDVAAQLMISCSRIVNSLEKKLLEKEALISEQASKVDALHKLTLTDGSLTITDSAKILGIRPGILFSFLVEMKWIYRRRIGSPYIGYQNIVQRGYIKHIVNIVILGDGSERIYEQVRITAMGLIKLAYIIKDEI